MGNRVRTELIERVFFWGNGFNKIFQDWNQIMSNVKKSKYNKKYKSLKILCKYNDYQLQSTNRIKQKPAYNRYQ